MVTSGCNVAKVVFTGTDEAQGTHDAGGDAPPDTPAGPHIAHVVSVTADVANATYGTGAVIPILVEFDTEVMITGMPAILLNVSGQATVFYTSGAGTKVLKYNYTVTRGNQVDHLDYKNDASLSFADGQIFNETGNADLTLPVPGAPGSLGANKQIAISTGTLQLNFTGVLQSFTVPGGITSVDIAASGATGGTSTGELGGLLIAGGKGAVARATFAVVGGQQLSVLVGGAGTNKSCGAGGGGGSWVVRGAELLLVAGGGGGGFDCQALGPQNGSIGEGGSSGGGGVCPLSRSAAAGGTNGNGGTALLGGGGGGWLPRAPRPRKNPHRSGRWLSLEN